MTTAFVAGATGYTGREVVRQLAESGVRTIAHVRPDSPSLSEWRDRFVRMGALVDTTPWDQHALESSLYYHAPDIVYALLGTTKARARAASKAGGQADYEHVDYGLTMMLLNAVRRSAPSAKFVYLSSLGASASAANAYLNVRGRVEEALMTSGLSYVVARPAIISGEDREERRLLERAAAVAGDRVLGWLARLGAPGLGERYSSISSEALARALVRVNRDPSAVNRVLDSAELHRRSR
jgi:uncharacterized protein YbjT (DUF2867 family)